tara:strand:+ start:83 stop:301 length:219 start_codon:yes stop_codon:yes gene_type:complete
MIVVLLSLFAYIYFTKVMEARAEKKAIEQELNEHILWLANNSCFDLFHVLLSVDTEKDKEEWLQYYKNLRRK